MEGISSSRPEHLVLLVSKLKEVFDMCDEDEDGFIRVEHFVHLGRQFGQTDEEIKKFAECLDPNANGKIGFKDFCHGVFAIKGCDEILKNVLDSTSMDTHTYQTDNSFYYQIGDESAVTLPCLLYPLDSEMDSSGGSESSDVRHDDKEEALGGLFLPGNSSHQLVSSAAASVISAEEQFEDYGEGEDVDFIPSSPCADDDTRTNGFSDLGSSLPSSAGHTPQKIRHFYNSELLDVYCSQCCKKVNLLNDLEARLKNLKANSPNRKISSTAFGRQLFHHSNFSSSHGSTEDLFRDSIDSCDTDITEKVSYLEKKVTELENDSLANGDLKSKLKQDNTQLVHRVHELEEQIKDQEARAEQSLEEELKRHRENYSKMEKDKSNQIELLSNRVQQLEEENSEMKVNVCRLKSQTEKLDQEKQRMTDKLEDTSLRLKDEMDLYRKMMDKLWQNRHEFQKEREAMQELIEDLRRELEHLQVFKLETEKPGRGRNCLSEFSARTREIELEHEVKRLRQENHKLRDQNDDLNGQILSLSLYEAKNLFACHTKAQSLATEIDNASRDELVEALKEQEEINFRLRQYMDKIILAILDHNPSILEIKH
ncbi:rab11 family-interacting protein 4A isoform X1 [Ictalurus punctatus]|uniref:Rab11 family-interacting protein 4A isoform X1 n=1 Tax=Ictalurus punctatus TaxID=7998 RepID=A0A2D0SAM6_ICTPU|nr:rab11 family-interacting protein 4A isoform X1 [Ictalurus punctatus]XP_053504525.1 rab11 family-interacting protein 4A isoform X1 [Ictalurus furcatus]